MDGKQLQALLEQRGYQLRNPTPQRPASVAVLRDGGVITEISLFALDEMTHEEIIKLVDRLEKHRVAQMEQVLHQCRYNHKWWVRMPYSSQYLDPRLRFCPTCLEEERIEVGSIRLTTYPMAGAKISYECPLCSKTGYIQLPPDFSFMDMTMRELGLYESNWNKPVPGWYCLPKHWPSVCKCHAWMEGRV